MYIVTIAARISQQRVVERRLERERAPWKLVCTLRGRPSSRSALDRLDRVAERRAGARLNEIVAAGKLADVVDRRAARALDDARIVDERTCTPAVRHAT
jgi:hypothetical protein